MNVGSGCRRTAGGDERGALAGRCLIPALVFVLLMFAFYSLYDPWSDVGTSILENGSFDRDPLEEPTPWEVRNRRVFWQKDGGFGAGPGIRLETEDESGGRLDFAIEDPQRFEGLRLTARMRTENAVLGSRPWRTTRILLFFVDEAGKPHWEVSHSLCLVTGTTGWKLYEKVFPVPDFAARGVLVVQNPAAEGIAWVDDISLIPVEGRIRILWDVLFATGWGAVFLLCVWRLRLWRHAWGLAVLASAGLILAGVASPAGAVIQVLEAPVEVVATVQERATNGGSPDAAGSAVASNPAPARGKAPPASTEAEPPSKREKSAESEPEEKPAETQSEEKPVELTPEQKLARLEIARGLKKFGHGLLFGVLGFFGALAARRLGGSVRLATSGMLVFAAGSELLQFLVDQRTPAWVDWSIDCAGLLVGVAVALAVARFLARWRPPRSVSA